MRAASFALAILTAPVLFAAAKPDFTGEWKMDPARSDFGPLPAPSAMTRKIEHNEPELRIATTQSGQRGEVRSELKYAVDGKEHVNKTPGGEVKSVLRWDGATLQVDSERQIGGATLKTQDRWSLSGDGKTMTTRTHLASPRGEADITVVFEKQ